MVHGENRIPYWIDRRLTGLAGPEYHAIISIGLPFEPEDSQYGKSRFTSSNAGSSYFEDYSDLFQLNKINWAAVEASKWSGIGVDQSVKEDKQAEFLVEDSFPWELVSRIGIMSLWIYPRVQNLLQGAPHRPTVEIKRDWYY